MTTTVFVATIIQTVMTIGFIAAWWYERATRTSRNWDNFFRGREHGEKRFVEAIETGDFSCLPSGILPHAIAAHKAKKDEEELQFRIRVHRALKK